MTYKYDITLQEYIDHYEALSSLSNRQETIKERSIKKSSNDTLDIAICDLPFDRGVFDSFWELSGRNRFINQDHKKAASHRFDRLGATPVTVNICAFDLEGITKASIPYSLPEESREVIAAATYRHVQKLCSLHRKSLIESFDDPALLVGGLFAKASASGVINKISWGEKCTLLMFLMKRVLDDINYSYKSDFRYDLWGVKPGYRLSKDLEIDEAPIKKISKDTIRLNVDPVVMVDECGYPSFLMECSAITQSLAELFFAFGIPFSSMRILRVGSYQGGILAVMTRKPSAEVRANIMAIPFTNTPPIASALVNLAPTPEAYPHLFYERMEDALKSKQSRKGFSKKNTSYDSEESRWASKNVKPVFKIDRSGSWYPTTMDFFDNHYLMEVESDLGAQRGFPDRSPRFYDPLYWQRYKNGPQDFLETYYIKRQHHISLPLEHQLGSRHWYMYGIVEYWSTKSNFKRVYTLPVAIYPEIRSWMGEWQFSEHKFRHEDAYSALKSLEHSDLFLNYENEKRKIMSAFSPEGGSKSLDYLSLMFGRYNILYLAVDEEDWKIGINKMADSCPINREHPENVIQYLGPFLNTSQNHKV